MAAGVSVTLVGDPRQGTFSTTQSRTNRGLTKSNIVRWLTRLEDGGHLQLRPLSHSRRCNAAICEFADSLYPAQTYPGFTRTQSYNTTTTGHDGVFLVRESDVGKYHDEHSPQLLVWSKASKTHGLPVRNMGEVKGLTYDRVLIQPTGPMQEYLRSGAALKPDALAKLYVAVTRARYSAAIILDKPASCSISYWYG